MGFVMSKNAELRVLWEKIRRIQRQRSRRAKVLDTRYASIKTYDPTDVRGLKEWIRRRGSGVDIRGLDDSSGYEKTRLRTNKLRHTPYYIPRLEKVDLDTLLFRLETFTPKDYSYLVKKEKKNVEEYLEKYHDVLEKYHRIDREEEELKKKIEGTYVYFKRYAPRDVFNEVLNTFRRIAVFDPDNKTWKVSPDDILRLDKDYLDKTVDTLERYSEYIGCNKGLSKFINVLRERKKLLRELDKLPPLIRVSNRDERYYYIPYTFIASGLIDNDKLVKSASYTRRVYDPELKHYIDKTYVLVKKVNGGYWYPRGLGDRLEKITSGKAVIQPFAPELVKAYDLKTPVKLRDYQAEAVSSILKYLALYGGSTLQAATGAGKTEIAVDIVKRVLDTYGKDRKIFFLSLSTDLLRQFKKRAEKYGIPVGLVTAEEFDISKPVVAVTVQSLYRALQKVYGEKPEEKIEKPEDVRLEEYDVRDPRKLVKLFEDARMIVFDEVQHVPAYTVKYVVKHAKKALRLGLSATPWRDDQRDLEIYAWIGDIVPRRITSSELIEKGFLVPAHILVAWYNDEKLSRELADLLAEARASRKSGARLYNLVTKMVYYNKKRNEWIARVAEKLKRMGLVPGLVLVKEKKHGRELEKKMRDLGLKAYFVSSELSGKKRERIFEMCRNNQLDFVIATSLADEGLDLPPLKVLMLVAGGKSKVKTLQRIGRVIRIYPGKKVGLVIDVADNVKYLRDHITERVKMYKTEPKWIIEPVNKQNIFHKIEVLANKYS